MSRIDDMTLFVEVVKAGGLAAAGRVLGLSPASMTARINTLEQRYHTRLLQRTTRSIALTEKGQQFYQACLRVTEEIQYAEALLADDQLSLKGRLRITAPSDFGRQYIAPALTDFCRQHPALVPHLNLSDSVENLVDQNFDLGVRFGNLPDSSLVARSLAPNRRVLVASPEYLTRHGEPQQPQDLLQHRCMVLERQGELLNNWQFLTPQGELLKLKVPATLSSNDGAVIRHWAVAGVGIAFKSAWDVCDDINQGRLQRILDQQVIGFFSGDQETIGLQLVYPDRRYLPRQVQAFASYLQQYFSELELPLMRTEQ